MSIGDEEDWIGEEMHIVPSLDPDEKCNGKKKMHEDGEVVRNEDNHVLFGGYCEAEAGKGTDHFGEGRCKHHAGQAGAPSHNQNNQKHALTADPHHYHQNLAPERKRWIEDMTHVILDRIRRNHGREPDPLDHSLARRVVIKLDMVGQASDYTKDELIQVVQHDNGSHEEKGALVEEIRRFDNAIMDNLKKLGVLEDPESQKANRTDEWRGFMNEGQADGEVIIDATDNDESESQDG